MNASCPRCQGSRVVHVTRVLDHVLDTSNTWLPRPVGTLPEIVHDEGMRGDRGRAIGHFQSSSCEDCGHTRWYACEWQPLVRQTKLAFCEGCRASTEHQALNAIENVAGGYQRVFFDTSLLNPLHQGPMCLSICVPCGLTSWSVTQLEADKVARALRYTADDPCSTCGQTDSISLGATEYEGEVATVAVKERRFLGMRFDEGKGRYVLRACLGCNAVTWRAHNLVAVKKAGLAHEERAIDTLRDPYR